METRTDARQEELRHTEDYNLATTQETNGLPRLQADIHHLQGKPKPSSDKEQSSARRLPSQRQGKVI